MQYDPTCVSERKNGIISSKYMTCTCSKQLEYVPALAYLLSIGGDNHGFLFVDVFIVSPLSGYAHVYFLHVKCIICLLIMTRGREIMSDIINSRFFPLGQ